MRTDEGEVLLEDFANGFHLGMSLNMDDWQPFLSDPEIAMSLVTILEHCETAPSTDARIAAVEAQTTHILAESWRLVPDVIEMLHQTLAGSRNIEIRRPDHARASVGRSQRRRMDRLVQSPQNMEPIGNIPLAEAEERHYAMFD